MTKLLSDPETPKQAFTSPPAALAAKRETRFSNYGDSALNHTGYSIPSSPAVPPSVAICSS